MCTLCGRISATHFPKCKKCNNFCDRKLKFGKNVGTYINYYGLKFQLKISSGSRDNRAEVRVTKKICAQ